jgi:thiamine kinase-like enzyme
MGNTDEANPPEVLCEPWMSISFKVGDSDPNSSKAQKQKLVSLVAKRNKLIHQELAYLNTSSMEDCCKLINLLDEQNPRLLAQLDDLKWMIESLREALAEILRSPEFLQLIESLNH